MRMTLDLPQDQLEALEALSKARDVAPDQLVREALDLFLRPKKPVREHASFGAWKNFPEGFSHTL